jgi:hypothetical protein
MKFEPPRQATSVNLQIHGRWRWGAACNMPRVSDIDGAYGISAHHTMIIGFSRTASCLLQVMRVWSLQALLSPLAKQQIR